MASVFKPSGSKKYVILYTDETGRRRKKTGATDKAVSERIARDLENRVALRREGVIDARTEAIATHASRPLAEHLAAWHRDMLARGKTRSHAEQYHDRAGKLAAVVRGVSPTELDPGRKPEAQERGARKLAETLASARLPDLSPERIQAALARLRDAGLSLQTLNHYRAALRAFVRWCVDTGRLRDNPMQGVRGFNAEEDRRHERRTLTDGELAALVRSAENGPTLFGMPGRLRAMAYRMAAATGFRVAELRTLTPEAFHDLDGPTPSVFLAASATKNRRPAEQPIPLALARDLAEWIANTPPGAPVFPLHHETAKAIRADLESAGVTYQTEEGVADFHALRGYFVGALVKAGASISEVRALARHAKPETTLKHYARVSAHDLRGVVENLAIPTPGATLPEALAATGTDLIASATESATVAIESRRNQLATKHDAKNIIGFAKPLGSERGLGGSNPPLSALDTSGSDTIHPNPHRDGGLGVARLTPERTTPRRNATPSNTTRPPRATKCATTSSEVAPPSDPDLTTVIDAWGELPEAIRQAIVTLARAAREGRAR